MECQKNGCNYEAMDTCRYCHKGFCSLHMKANKPSSPGLNSEHWTRPPIDGHPCSGLPSSAFKRNSPSSYSNYAKSNKSGRTFTKAVIITAIVVIILYILFSNNIIKKDISSSLSSLNSNISKNSATTQTSSIAQQSNSQMVDVVFCVNRMVFRTSDSRGLNQSQVENLINYCAYYNYNPGVVNGTDYTQICQGVKECRT